MINILNVLNSSFNGEKIVNWRHVLSFKYLEEQKEANRNDGKYVSSELKPYVFKTEKIV